MILAISGKSQSGKDTVGKIILYLTDKLTWQSDKSYNDWLATKQEDDFVSEWKIKKFADKLKDIVCLLIGCTREQLEDETFKSTELGQEWWYWKLEREGGYSIILLPYNKSTGTENFELIKTTPRKLLQLLGTECGRDIIHPNIWVNSLMSEYKPINEYRFSTPMSKGIKTIKREYTITTPPDKDGFYIIPDIEIIPEKNRLQKVPYKHVIWIENIEDDVYPNLIITDLRFPNEYDAVKQRGGITIRVNRNQIKTTNLQLEHTSETALDSHKFDYVIDNNGSILDLIEKVRVILIKEKIIN